jgi:hypothetical protein
MARVAPAAQAVLSQATFHRPKRSKASDGTVGDRAHRRTASDHNPDSRGIVMACDLTHDPARGMDAHGWARWIAKRGDRRIKYLISNRQIWEPGGIWRRYSGANPHTLHAHVSIARGHEYDTSPWFQGWLYGIPAPAPTPAPPPPIQLPVRSQIQFGERGRLVEIAQWELATISGYRFPPETIGVYGLHLAQAVQNLGRILGKNWDGTYIGPDQWSAVDFMYLGKGQRPVTS